MDEDMSYDKYESHITVLGTHQIARRASLPLETFILAALILKQLESDSEKFYDDWIYELRKAEVSEDDRCKEVVVLSAIVYLLLCDQLIGRLLPKSFCTMRSTSCLRGPVWFAKAEKTFTSTISPSPSE